MMSKEYVIRNDIYLLWCMDSPHEYHSYWMGVLSAANNAGEHLWAKFTVWTCHATQSYDRNLAPFINVYLLFIMDLL